MRRSFTHRLATLFAAGILMVTLLVGCGSNPAPQLPPVPSNAISNVETNVVAFGIKVLGVIDAAVVVATKSGQLYLDSAKTGAVPAEIDKEIRGAFTRFGQGAQSAVAELRKGVKTWEDIRKLLQPLVDQVNGLIDLANRIASAGTWRDRMSMVLDILNTAFPKPGELPEATQEDFEALADRVESSAQKLVEVF